METRIEEATQMMKGTVSAWSPSIISLVQVCLSIQKVLLIIVLLPINQLIRGRLVLIFLKWDLINPSRTPQINTAKANFENAKIFYTVSY